MNDNLQNKINSILFVYKKKNDLPLIFEFCVLIANVPSSNPSTGLSLSSMYNVEFDDLLIIAARTFCFFFTYIKFNECKLLVVVLVNENKLNKIIAFIYEINK